jgi:thiol-disulfide isomerase/thioredoxin
MGMSGNGRGFILVDPQGRYLEFPTSKTGSVLLVEFMTTVCPNSKAAIPSLVDFQSRYALAGLQVIAVACDEPTTAQPRMDQKQRAEAASKYAKDNNLNYQVFVEPGEVSGSVRDRFNVKMYPTAVLMDGTGAVLWQGHPNKRADLEAAIKQALGK